MLKLIKVTIVTHFILECPLYNSIREKFQWLFEKVVLGSLNYFFQLDYLVEIDLFLEVGSDGAHKYIMNSRYIIY